MESGALESPNPPDCTEGFPVDHWRDGAMIPGRVGAEEVVLVRRRDDFFAVGATGAHSHGPLAKGIGGGEKLCCPYTTPALVCGRRRGIAISYTLRCDRASGGGAEVVGQILERSDGGHHCEKHRAQEGGSPLKADVDRGTRTRSEERAKAERRTDMATHAATAGASQRLEPLTKRRSWKALQAHYRKVNELHLRT